MDPLALLAQDDAQFAAASEGRCGFRCHHPPACCWHRFACCACCRGRLHPSLLTACFLRPTACLPACRREEGEEGGEGLDTGVHGSVADRAAAARAVMLRRDREDKAQLRELRKQQRQEKRVRGGGGPAGGSCAVQLANGGTCKCVCAGAGRRLTIVCALPVQAKRLAREAPEEGGVAVLGGASDSEGGSGYSSGEGGSGSDWSEGEEAGARRGGRGAGAPRGGPQSDSEPESEGEEGLDVDLLESSDDEEPRPAGGKRRRGPAPEAAHLGMLPAGAPQGGKRAAAASGEDGEAGGAAAKRQKRQKQKGAGALSLEEQEALALRLLGARR